ncbi:hypothetical protein [Metabacillus sp. Hm71]|uniref:hypothetical protein n=1 Tax=Metabacillus sp. Hm71 TaxID=3450743 RepID=UPI003F43A2E8
MIKFFIAEDLYNYLEDNQVNVLGQKLENDSDLLFHERLFFYFENKENELLVKYPELKDVIEDENIFDFQTYIEWQYETGEDKQIGNIILDEEALKDLAMAYLDDEEFLNNFMNNPSETFKKMDHDITEVLFTSELMEQIEQAKEQRINVHWGMIDLNFRNKR